MKTWLLIVTVVAVLLAATAGVEFWMLVDTKAELANMEVELADIKAELTDVKAELDQGGEDSTPPAPTSDCDSENAVSWDEAQNYIGEWATENNPVYGPVVGASYRPDISGQPTWLNIGEDYPSQDRFVVIIWGDNRNNFPWAPENYYLGKTICVTGLITEYNGVAQIEVTSPNQIHE